MSELLSKIDVSAEVVARRATIINSVLKYGLKSSEQLQKEGSPYFGSFDDSPSEFISFMLLLPPNTYKNQQDFLKALDRVLYHDTLSVLPVMAERKGSYMGNDVISKVYNLRNSSGLGIKQDEENVLERRVSSSFIVLINESMETLREKSKRWSSGRNMTDGIEILGKPKDGCSISPNRFSYLLFPEDVGGQYGNEQENVVIIKRKIKRKLFNRGIQLSVPDYESAILEILEETNDPLWIHGVRLPNEEDVTH